MDRELEMEMRKLSDILDTLPPSNPRYDEAYNRYFEISAILHEEYKRDNIDSLREFYEGHIEGKDMHTVDLRDWEWYSDYHKDVFGYRPRSFEFDA